MVETNPFATLQQITSGYILSRCLHVVADLGVADALDETPRTATELASLVDAHPDALRRTPPDVEPTVETCLSNLTEDQICCLLVELVNETFHLQCSRLKLNTDGFLLYSGHVNLQDKCFGGLKNIRCRP